MLPSVSIPFNRKLQVLLGSEKIPMMMAIELTDFDNHILLEFQDTEKWGQVWSLVCTAAQDDSAGAAVIVLSLPTSPHVSLSILPSKIPLRGMKNNTV